MGEWSKIAFDIATWIIPLTTAIVFHEVAHGLTARHFGDMTAARAGRLSLNPLRHVDPFGTVILPLMLAISGAPVFGWAKGVPVVARRLRNLRWHMVLVALAGPASNILLALIGAVLAGLLLLLRPVEGGLVWALMVANLQNFVLINLFLAVFNILPLPPFDGSKVLGGFLPPALAKPYQRLDRYGLFIMLGVLVVLPSLSPSLDIVGLLVEPPVRALLELTAHIATAIGGVR